MVNEHSNQPDSQSDSMPANDTPPVSSETEPTDTGTIPDENVVSVSPSEGYASSEATSSDQAAPGEQVMSEQTMESMTSESSADGPVVETSSQPVVDEPDVSPDPQVTATAADSPEPASQSQDADDDWDDDAVTPPQGEVLPEGASSANKTAVIAKTIAVITLVTIIQGADTLTSTLESIQIGKTIPDDNQPSPPIWLTVLEILLSLLIALGLTSARFGKSASCWVLQKVDDNSYTAVNEGRAPFLRDRIQATDTGAKIWAALDNGWSVWCRGVEALRGILPKPVKHWSNPQLTVLLLSVAFLIVRLTAAVSPSNAQEAVVQSNSGPVITAAPSAQPLLFGDELVNDPSDQTTVANLQKQFDEALKDQAQYQGVLNDVVIDRQRDRLILVLEQHWYDLTQPQKQTLASQLAKTAQDNQFSTLTLVDLAGVRVGRSPVVGNDMILFQTSRPLIELSAEDLPIEDIPVAELPAE